MSCKLLFFLVLMQFPVLCKAQNTIALPAVANYSKQVYGGGLQNWKIKEDHNGIIYIANNEGLLSYDGRFWNIYPLPNRTIVHSIEITSDSRIYVGGQDEVGYFDAGYNGRLQYHSLIQSFPADRKSFGDVWDIVSFKNEVFFRTNKGIYKLSNGKVTVYNPQTEWLYMGKCNGTLYAQDVTQGMMSWENGTWKIIENQQSLKKNDPITSIISLPAGQSILTTLKSGLFAFDSSGITPRVFSNEQRFIKARIYGAVALSENQLALGTSNEGLLIIDFEGNIIQTIKTSEGLQNNNVLSLLADERGNIWLGLDNGIDMISYNSAIKLLNPLQQNGSGYTALINNNELFLGTTNGLYSTRLQNLKDLSFSLGQFIPVKNTTGQNWSLANIAGHVLLGHHEGAFEIKKDIAIPLKTNTGFWNFNLFNNDSFVVAGTYSGIEIFKLEKEKINYAFNIPHFTESSRYVAIDSDKNIWVSHPYHGIFKIQPLDNGTFNIQKYTDKEGLPSILNNHIFKIRNEILAATSKGIYLYNKTKNTFEASPYYKSILGDQSIRYLKESPAGNVWFVHEKTLSVIDFTGKNPEIIPIPQLTNKILSGFEAVYPYNENNILVSGEKGFFHINYEKLKSNLRPLKVQVRTVKISDGKDSLLFGGYYAGVNEKQLQLKNIPFLPYSWKTIRFEFSATAFAYPEDLEYAYRLRGFDAKWSDWSNRTEKEYSNLDAGDYTFEVKVRNSVNTESEVATYKFKMLAPWYFSTQALFFYILIFAAGLFFLYKWLKKKFRLQRQKYEQEQVRLKYIHDLEQNKTRNELIALQNEKLETDISFKNAELAAAAMHLVKKGELLTKIKKDLSQVTKEMRNPETIAAIKDVVKKVGDDDKLDEEWESFARHFDAVHSGYLVNLKARHPDLTSNELKLCANLRMNLSTKEIAQLMNISVRGVEISRYRLRKKLVITTEINLFDYLMKI